jgi:hypothetical protein
MFQLAPDSFSISEQKQLLLFLLHRSFLRCCGRKEFGCCGSTLRVLILRVGIDVSNLPKFFN